MLEALGDHVPVKIHLYGIPAMAVELFLFHLIK
jgi:hypothetical protein